MCLRFHQIKVKVTRLTPCQGQINHQSFLWIFSNVYCKCDVGLGMYCFSVYELFFNPLRNEMKEPLSCSFLGSIKNTFCVFQVFAEVLLITKSGGKICDIHCLQSGICLCPLDQYV